MRSAYSDSPEIPPPPGFEKYQRHGDEYPPGLELFLPARVKDALVAQDVQQKRDDEAKVLEARAAQVSENQRLQVSSTSQHSGRDNSKTDDKDGLKKEMIAWSRILDADKAQKTRWNYAVFRSEQAVAFFKGLGRGDADDRARLDKIYQELLQRGTTLREIARPKSLKPLQTLAQKQPHMKEVVNFVMAQINMARHSQKPVRLQPMLLVGEAGVGKTHFAQALAQALSTTIYIQALDSDLTSSVFLGSDRKWGNSQNGVLFETVVLGQHANPIIVLDEIDKSPRSLSYGAAVSSLYSVLEPVSAKGVRDISLMFEFDASQVTWIATANTARYLDPPLRSRFREFHIMPPTAAECLVLAEEVMRASIQSVGIKGFKPDVSLRRHLAHLPARQIFQLTLDAIANAVAADRKELCQVDFPGWLFEDEAGANERARSNYIH